MAADDLAADASPARELQGTMRRLARRWQLNFDRGAPELAAWFAQSAAERADAALQAALKRAGFSVGFKLSAAANDVIQATTFENVGLIRTIAQQHLAEVEQLVMRNVAQGRDIQALTDDLHARYEITRRRATIIARDQNNKATATVTRVRQKGLGVTEAIWMHSRGGKVPRQSHVDFSGKRYDIEKGAFLDGKWVWPGTEINCRCVCKAILPGFD
jgi:SPP1 gp7 family putative phage head morphogenesis protein